MNVQQTIIKGIKEQLFYNDYLVLPNFGGFVLKSNSAHFSASGTLLMPPSKTVSFNSQLKQNDGILATWLQTQLACTAIEALKHLHEFAEFCTSILNTRRRLNLDNIGFFYLDFENNICFEPQQDSNFLIKSFGLSAMNIQEISLEETKEPKKQIVFEDRIIARENALSAPQKTKRNYSKLIAPSIVALFFLSLLFLIVSNQKIGGKLQASLFGRNKASMYSPLTYSELGISKNETQNQAYLADVNGIATLELNDKIFAVKAVENSIVKKSTTKISLKKNKKQSFQVVLGCFAVLDNANKLAAKLSEENISASVSGKHKGLYVVSVGANSRHEAVSTLLEVKSIVPKAWIKKM